MEYLGYSASSLELSTFNLNVLNLKLYYLS